jgi:hypothetical protein
MCSWSHRTRWNHSLFFFLSFLSFLLSCIQTINTTSSNKTQTHTLNRVDQTLSLRFDTSMRLNHRQSTRERREATSVGLCLEGKHQVRGTAISCLYQRETLMY